MSRLRSRRPHALALWLGPVLLGFSNPAAASPAQAGQTKLAPGLEYRDFDCAVSGRTLHFEELRLHPGHGLELRAIANPSAHPDSRCRDGYGGRGLPGLLSKASAPGAPFEVLGATNGNFFREVKREKRRAYASNALVWSRGAGLIAPLRRRGGKHLFVADAKGAHELLLDFSESGNAKDSAKLVSLLKSRYPTMSLALQSNLPLTGNSVDCPSPGSGDWRCVATYRTVLCGRRDGTISLMTVPGALPSELALGLRKGGSCRAGCEFLYNLDGGGSTQLARRSSETKDRYLMTGRKIETSEPGCNPYRPVDHYLVIGRPRRSSAAE